MKDKSDSATPERMQVISAGLAVVALGAVLQLLQVQQLNRRLLAALYLFAAAIPILIACWSHYVGKHHRQQQPDLAVDLTFLVGSLAVTGGVSLVFFHLNIIGGSVFIVAVVVAIALEWWTSD